VEIARTVGERLIDSKASNALAHRLMEQERQHVAETRVIDQQTRRVLHDDILPRLQSLMIKLSSNISGNESLVSEMSEIQHRLAALMHDLPSLVEPEIAYQGLVEALKVSIENDYHSYFNRIDWHVDEQVSDNSKSFTPYVSNVLYHATREAVRNAAHHGRQAESDQLLNLIICMTWQNGLTIKVEDNGLGFNLTTINDSYDGHGLAIHSTLMAVIGGSLSVDSIPGKNTSVILQVPVQG
jgi:signal transduction histidine kinase